MYHPLTLNGYSNFINAVKRQRNLGLTLYMYKNVVMSVTKAMRYRDVPKVFGHWDFLLYISCKTTFFKNIIPFVFKCTIINLYCIFDVENLVLCLNRELIKIIDYKFMLKLQCKTTGAPRRSLGNYFYSCPAIFEVPLYLIIDRTSDSCGLH
jgi:hypothetical protein